MPMKNSMELVKRRRPGSEPIPAFIKMLEEYEQTCLSLGVIHQQPPTQEMKTIKRQAGPMPPSNGPTKRTRTVGPAIGPAIGPAAGPIHDQQSDQKATAFPSATGGSEEEAGIESESSKDHGAIGPSLGP
jgi:hypothetical protein